MNLHNLIEGNSYKNYKDLCHTLEEKTKTGTAKQAQLKEWNRHFSYEKSGHKFIINEIYTTPKPKEDGRSQGNNVTEYITTIEKLILDLLVQDNDDFGSVHLSKNRLLKCLKMINDNYMYCKNKTVKLSQIMNITKEEIEDFYESSNNTLTRNLETALKSLEDQALISWTHSKTICYLDTDIQTNEIGGIKAHRVKHTDEDGNSSYSYDLVTPVKEFIHRKANETEVKYILEAERVTLDKYECQTKHEIFKKGLADKFFEEVNEILFSKANIIYYYNSYHILCNEHHIYQRWIELEELKLTSDEKEDYQYYLNESVMDKLNSNAESRHNKAKSLLQQKLLTPIKDIIHLRGSKHYLTNTRELSNTLIHKEAYSLRKDMEKENLSI